MPIILPSDIGRTHVKDYEYPWHVQAFENHFLTLLRDRNYNRLVVECACRHGKSHQWSRLFPLWYLLTRPGKNVMIVGATQDMVGEEFISWIHRHLQRIAPAFGRYVDRSQCNKSHVRVLGNGEPSELYGFGRNGFVASRGVHLLIGDDLLRDEADDLTPAARRKVNVWWQSEAMSRLEPGGKVAIVMSRRHPQDLSGYCLSQNGTLAPCDQWHSVKFPAIGPGNKALWPERFPIDFLERKRKELADVGDEWIFSSLWMQDPRGDPSTCEWPDSYFPPSIWYTELPRGLAIRAAVVSCDLSKGAKSKAGDYTAILYILWDNNGNLWVEDSWMRACPLTEGVGRFAEMIVARRPHAAIIETMGDQIIVDETNRQLDLAGVHGIAVYPYRSNDNKDMRIRSGLTGWLHRGKIHFRDTPANRLVVSQFRSFPNGDHDDGPDSANMGVTLLDEHFA